MILYLESSPFLVFFWVIFSLQNHTKKYKNYNDPPTLLRPSTVDCFFPFILRLFLIRSFKLQIFMLSKWSTFNYRFPLQSYSILFITWITRSLSHIIFNPISIIITTTFQTLISAFACLLYIHHNTSFGSSSFLTKINKNPTQISIKHHKIRLIFNSF